MKLVLVIVGGVVWFSTPFLPFARPLRLTVPVVAALLGAFVLLPDWGRVELVRVSPLQLVGLLAVANVLYVGFVVWQFRAPGRFSRLLRTTRRQRTRSLRLTQILHRYWRRWYRLFGLDDPNPFRILFAYLQAGDAKGAEVELAYVLDTVLDQAGARDGADLFMLAQLRYQLGDYDEARHHYSAAQEALDVGDEGDFATLCLAGLARIERDLGRPEVALDLLRSAPGDEGSAAPVDSARLLLGIGQSELALGRSGAAHRSLREARSRFREEGLDAEADVCELEIAGIMIHQREFDCALRLFETLRRNFQRSHSDWVSAASCTLGIGRAQAGLGRTEAALRNCESAAADFLGLGMPVEAADARYHGALAAASLGLTGSARRRAQSSALAALSTLEAWRYRLVRPVDRRRWARRWEAAHRLALQLAAELHDHRLLAELIEVARVQAVPAGTHGSDVAGGMAMPSLPSSGPATLLKPRVGARARGTRETRAGIALSTAASAAGALPLAPAPAVAVGGRSALGPLRTGERPRVLSLEEVAASLAPQAWWWGLWSTDDRVYWSLVAPEADVRSGWMPVRHDLLGRLAAASGDELEEERSEIDAYAARVGLDPEAVLRMRERVVRARVLGSSLVGDEGAAQRELVGLPDALRRLVPAPLVAPETAEQLLATELGAWLIPEVLADALASRSGEGCRPLDLVVASGPAFGRLPFALLGVPGTATPGVPEVRRVLEAAVVRTAPSAALLDALRSRRVADGAEPAVVVVADPLGDLRYANHVPDGATAVLGGSDCEASPEALTTALSSVEAGCPGVFAYQGHHDAPDPEEPVDSGGFVLPGPGGPVSYPARALLRPAVAGRPNCPRQALLLGCDTLGAGSNEWTGMTVAMIWAGASEVLSTLWPTFDNPRAAEMEADLIDAAVAGRSLAETLQALQVQQLHARRSGLPVAPPYVWAAYSVAAAPGSA